MRRLILLALCSVLVLGVNAAAVAQDAGTSTQATTLCVVIYGDTPNSGWDQESLMNALATVKAIVAEIKDPAACAGAATPAPVAGSGAFFTLSGTGSKTSAPFAAPSQWQLQYTYDCSSFGSGTGNFQVWLYNGSDPAGVPVNELGASGASSSYVYEGGPAMHIEVNSECDWSITATP